MSNVDIPQEEIEKANEEKLHKLVAREIRAIATGNTRYLAARARNLVALMAEADLRQKNARFLRRRPEPTGGPYPLD